MLRAVLPASLVQLLDPNMGLMGHQSIEIHQVKQEVQMLTGHCSITFGKATKRTQKISPLGHDLLALEKSGNAFFFFLF